MNKNTILFITFLLFAALSCKKNDSTNSTTTIASVSSLLCSGTVFNNDAYINSPFSATALVPYLGGNGGSYSNSDSIRSIGVTGLTAVLQMGILQNGNGNLTYLILGTPIGTPARDSIANFPINFGGHSCSLQLKVKPPINGGAGAPSIIALDCSSVSFSVSTATVNSVYAATATVPYAGGNGAAYAIGAPISSTGVLGLSATLQPGTLSNGNGNFSYLISGTPTSTGTATFPVSFSGQTCSFNLTVNASGGGTTTNKTIYDSIYGAYSITYDANNVIIKTHDQPDHKSVYWPTSNSLYEAFSGPTYNNLAFNKAPNTISTQNITITIPLHPTVAANHAATPLGVIGIGLDGVPFFNQYAAGGTPLTGEIGSFDQYWGHPQMSGMYHYHVEPKYLTTVHATKHSLMGFLLDGFPVYGPEEIGGATPTGLDAYHGHTHSTTEYPSGIYHYHFTADAPYLNGNGFYGTKGTVTQ